MAASAQFLSRGRSVHELMKSVALAGGWNTWNTQSVLSHVHLTTGFTLNLGLCHYGMLATLTDATFGQHLAALPTGSELAEAELPRREIAVYPGPHTYDGSYTSVRVKLGEVELTIESACVDERDFVLLVSSSKSKWKPPALLVEACFSWNLPGTVEDIDGVIIARTADGEQRLYTTGVIGSDPNQVRRAPTWVIPLSDDVAVSTSVPRDIEECREIVGRARTGAQTSHRRFGSHADLHEAMQSCLAWNVIYDPQHERVICPVSRHWNKLRLGYGIFCWDSFFAAWLLALDTKELSYACALETFRDMVAGKFVPNCVNGSGRRTWDRSQPPIGSMAVRAIYLRHAELDFVREAWAPLLAWNRWWHRERRNKDGLLSWGSQPFEPTIGDPAEFWQPGTSRGAALESGLDNSPMYDGVPFDDERHLMCLSDVGLASLYITDCRCLADLAERLGYASEASELTARAAGYADQLQTLWSESAGIFLNRRTDTGEFSQQRSPTLLYPLMAGVATERQAARMVGEHLECGQGFGGEWTLPSISRDNPAFADQNYWRGRIWAPMNFLVYLGLKQYGFDAQARELAERSAQLLRRSWREDGAVYENYCANTGEGGNVTNSDPFYHWTGLFALMQFAEDGLYDLPLPPRAMTKGTARD